MCAASSPQPRSAGDDRSFLSALVESLMEGLVVCDREQRLVLVNPAAGRSERSIHADIDASITEAKRAAFAVIDAFFS